MKSQKIIDSHCHLNMLSNIGSIVSRYLDTGIEYVLCSTTSFEEIEECISISNRFNSVYLSVGIHPTENLNIEIDMSYIEKICSLPLVIGIGETGLDYYKTEGKYERKKQQERFREHIRIAMRIKKPLVIHSRNSTQDVLRILDEEGFCNSNLKCVFHCFTDTIEEATRIIEYGFYIGVSGIVTFKKANNIHVVAKEIPLENILLETDSPFMTPEPFRGKSNEPSFLTYVAQKIAQLKNVSIDYVSEITNRNFHNLFMNHTT